MNNKCKRALRAGDKFISLPERAGRTYELVDIVERIVYNENKYHLLFSYTSESENGEMEWFSSSANEAPDFIMAVSGQGL